MFYVFIIFDSVENEYVMKCVMCVVVFSGVDVKFVVMICL